MNKYISLTRDSVCAGDDTDAPHEMLMCVEDCKNVTEIMIKIKNKYLPKIDGGKATWIVHSRTPIAVVAQEWHLPKIIDDLDNIKNIYIEYKCQEDPELIYKSLLKYGAV